MISSHTLTDYPKELQKKVTLLQHFRSYLEGDAKGQPVAAAEPSEDLSHSKKTASSVTYVKKWMRTRHAIMFRLSNKIVQVNFQDHTEIILSSETREVTYVNKKGERTTYPLTTALESTNAEMSKRLKYTKDILTHMLSANQHHEGLDAFFTPRERKAKNTIGHAPAGGSSKPGTAQPGEKMAAQAGKTVAPKPTI